MKRQNRTPLFLVLGCAAFFFLSSEAFANIVIKVRALNPLETEETASISYPLPAEVTPRDIIEKKITFSLPPEEDQEVKTTFNIEYLPEEGRYYIVDEVPLGPREVVTLEVRVRDIWSIAPETLTRKRTAVEDLISQYRPAAENGEEMEAPEEDGKGTEEEIEEGTEEEVEEAVDDETIAALKEQIFGALQEIADRQAKSTVLKVGVEQHMEVYYENLETLSQLDADIEMLRYLLEPEPEEEDEDLAPEDEQLQGETDDMQGLQEETPLPDVPSGDALTQEEEERSEE